MGVLGNNVDLDWGNMVGNAFKFIVSGKLMDGETAVGVYLDDLVDNWYYGGLCAIGDGFGGTKM